MAASASLVESLRAEIDRKHQEALNALVTLSAYLTDSQLVQVMEKPRAVRAPRESTKQPQPDGGTQVERVLGAIAAKYKTARDLAKELGMPVEAVRAVLYSKYVSKGLSRKKSGKAIAFRQKKTAGDKPGVDHSKDEVTAASLVRDTLAKHPDGLTTTEIMSKISVDLEKIGGKKAAVTAALYNMKQRGKLAHDASSGTYRSIALAG